MSMALLRFIVDTLQEQGTDCSTLQLLCTALSSSSSSNNYAGKWSSAVQPLFGLMVSPVASDSSAVPRGFDEVAAAVAQLADIVSAERVDTSDESRVTSEGVDQMARLSTAAMAAATALCSVADGQTCHLAPPNALASEANMDHLDQNGRDHGCCCSGVARARDLLHAASTTLDWALSVGLLLPFAWDEGAVDAFVNQGWVRTTVPTSKRV